MGQLHGLFGKSATVDQAQLVTMIAGLIAEEGLGGLVLRFAASGNGPQVESWVTERPNQRLSARQVRQVFGPDKITELAATCAANPKRVSQGLAVMLPRAIDRLTPDGTVPSSLSLRHSLPGLEGLLEAS